MVPLSVVQVNINGGHAVRFGITPVLFTATVAVLVQPFVGFVTVTVYVPAAFTVGLEVVPPETIPGPAQT